MFEVMRKMIHSLLMKNNESFGVLHPYYIQYEYAAGLPAMISGGQCWSVWL
jgi:hypothetical protein